MALHLTREGYEKLQKELVYLRTTRRYEVIKALEVARAHGDLRENAEYDSAKHEQGLLEKRIGEIEDTLSNASILDTAAIDASKVYLGAHVTVKDLTNDKQLQYMIVSKEEAHLKDGKISVESPVGRSLLAKSVGDAVTITIPAGTLQYKILKIER